MEEENEKISGLLCDFHYIDQQGRYTQRKISRPWTLKPAVWSPGPDVFLGLVVLERRDWLDMIARDEDRLLWSVNRWWRYFSGLACPSQCVDKEARSLQRKPSRPWTHSPAFWSLILSRSWCISRAWTQRLIRYRY